MKKLLVFFEKFHNNIGFERGQSFSIHPLAVNFFSKSEF